MSGEPNDKQPMRLWPNTEGQAKVAIALLCLLVVAAVGGMIWFGVARRILAE